MRDGGYHARQLEHRSHGTGIDRGLPLCTDCATCTPGVRTSGRFGRLRHGYSSLSYLRQFPLDFLKIDRSFIVDLSRGDAERAIVVAIIGLAHALDLAVVAEGVETLDQLRVLQELQCDFAQGFLFARSIPPDSVSAVIAAGPPPELRGQHD